MRLSYDILVSLNMAQDEGLINSGYLGKADKPLFMYINWVPSRENLSSGFATR